MPDDRARMLGTIVFHCQQAVEKTMKAFLVWHERPFRRIHDLVELGQRGSSGTRASRRSRRGKRLRRPVAIAREVYEVIITRLPAEARP